MAWEKQQRWEAGDPVPRFVARATGKDNFKFDTVAGRYIVLMFFGSGAVPAHAQAIQHVLARRDLIDGTRGAFFGVSIEPQDEANGRLQQDTGVRFFWDFDKAVSKLYGAVPADNAGLTTGTAYRPFTLILDPMMRVMTMIPLRDADAHNRAFDAFVNALPDLDGYAGVPLVAPVLIVPRVFEPEFCRELIKLYDTHGGSDSGFMREVDGKTFAVLDHTIKRRHDFLMDQEGREREICAVIRERFKSRLIPEVKKAFQYDITRMERYIVSRYDGASSDFFSAHRDNTTAGTAHRRFACSLNLNTEEYEGGDLRFAEFGTRTYRAPTGGAVIFSCSLMHEATPVTRGARYAFLPFFYDDAAADIRQQNLHALSGETINKNTPRAPQPPKP